MTTQPPFNEFHKIKTENAQFNITIEQKDKLLKQRENKLQELTIKNDKKKTENLSLQKQVEITQEKITQFQKEVEQKQELLQQCENKLRELNQKKEKEIHDLQKQLQTALEEIDFFRKEFPTQLIPDLQKQLQTALEEIEFRKQFPTQLEQFLLQLESGNRIVIVAAYNSKESAQKKVKQIKSQHPELFWVQKGTPLHNHFGDGIYKDPNKWVVYIGGYYSSDSAQKLVKKAMKELGMPHDTYYQPVSKKYTQ
jgi:predicted RNase H-like nuclease (RuvC/YqgF family)